MQAQCNGWLKSIENKPDIPQRVLDALAKLEARESELQRQIKLETAKTMASRPPAESFKTFQQEVEQPAVKIDRVKCRELLRGFVEKIVVNPADQTYRVHFKSGAEPMVVTLIAV